MLKRNLPLFLCLIVALSPALAQESPMSLLEVNSAPGEAKNGTVNGSTGETSGPSVSAANDNKSLIREIESDLLSAFMWYEGIILTADTEELGTRKYGTTYRIWTREKHTKMKEYAEKLRKSLRQADEKTLQLRRQVLACLSEAEIYRGEDLEAYGALVRFISILTTFEHWTSCRRIHFDNGAILGWNDSERAYDLLGEYGLTSARSFPKLTLSRDIPLDEGAKKLVANPLANFGRKTFTTMQMTYEYRDSFVRHTNTFGSRYGHLDMSKLPETMNFGDCLEKIYEGLARPAYYKFLHHFILSTAFLSECAALMSIGNTLKGENDGATFSRNSRSFNEYKRYWQVLTDWANDRSFKRGWSRKFTVLPASFGTKQMAFPYGEITFNNLQIADFAKTTTD